MTVNLHQRGVELAEAGMYAEALGCIREHLLAAPRDGRALNDAGTVLYALGDYQQAAVHLQAAAAALGDDGGQALWNLSEAHLAGGAPQEALALFDRMEQAQLLTPDLANRTATCFLDAGELARAVEALIRSLRICPDQDALIPILELIRTKRAKVAFFCGNCGDRRDEDMDGLSDVFEYVVARFDAQLIYDRSARQAAEGLRWCDIAWFDACAELMPPASELPRGCRIILRLPAEADLCRLADAAWWQSIDAVVMVGDGLDGDPPGRSDSQIDSTVEVLHLPGWPQIEKAALLRIDELLCELERRRDYQMS